MSKQNTSTLSLCMDVWSSHALTDTEFRNLCDLVYQQQRRGRPVTLTVIKRLVPRARKIGRCANGSKRAVPANVISLDVHRAKRTMEQADLSPAINDAFAKLLPTHEEFQDIRKLVEIKVFEDVLDAGYLDFVCRFISQERLIERSKTDLGNGPCPVIPIRNAIATR